MSKLGNLLATFENNIQRNKEFGPCESGSFLSGSTTSTPSRQRRRSITGNQNISSKTDEEEDASQVNYAVRWSPKKTPTLTPSKCRRRLPTSIVPLPYNDDSESDLSASVCSPQRPSASESDDAGQSSASRGKRVRKVVIKKKKKKRDTSVDSRGSKSSQRSRSSQRSSRRSSSSSAKRRSSSGSRRRSMEGTSPCKPTDDAYCSPTEDTSSFESQNDETIPDSEKSTRPQNEKSVSSLPAMSTDKGHAASNVTVDSLPVLRTSNHKPPLNADNSPRRKRATKISQKKNDKREEERWSSDSSCSTMTPPRQSRKLTTAPLSPIPNKPKAQTCPVSPVPNAYQANVQPREQRKVYPRSPLPNKTKIKSAVASITLSVSSDEGEVRKPVVMHNAGRKTITVKQCGSSPIKEGVNSFPSDLSILTFDNNKQAVPCPKSPKPLLRTNSETSSWSNGEISRNIESSPIFEYDPVQLLSSHKKPVSILLERNHSRNTTRRVKFADQQPGGGRRMSMESMSSRDSLPMRPRRSSLDHLATNHGMGVLLKSFAITKIQATVRCWLQYKETKVELLERKLVRIEQTKLRELQEIQECKWKKMDELRRDAVERERRLESQVALGDKLIDHLKKDGALVKEQTKKLKEHVGTLKKNNEQLEKAASLNVSTFEAMSTAIVLLQEKARALEMTEKELTEQVEQKEDLLQASNTHAHCHIRESEVFNDGISKIVALLSEKSDDKQLVETITRLAEEGRNQRLEAFEKSFGLESIGLLPDNFNKSSSTCRDKSSSTALEKSFGFDSLLVENTSIGTNSGFRSTKDFESAKTLATCSLSRSGSIGTKEKVRPLLNYQMSGDSFADYCPSDLVVQDSDGIRIDSIAEHEDESSQM